MAGAFLLPFAAWAARVEPLPALPPGELPNSEVVTNIALNVDFARLERLFFTLELNAGESNSLSIAVGAAAGNELSLEEADFEWGYDCGTWFYADTATGCVSNEVAAAGRIARTLALNRRLCNPAWNTVRIVKRGLGELEANVTQSQEFSKFIIGIR